MRQQQDMFKWGDGQRLRRWAIAAVCAVSAMALASATAAQASVISIGSVLPDGCESKKFDRVETLFNTALPESGATLASPVNGAIVRWRVQGAERRPLLSQGASPERKRRL